MVAYLLQRRLDGGCRRSSGGVGYMEKAKIGDRAGDCRVVGWQANSASAAGELVRRAWKAPDP